MKLDQNINGNEGRGKYAILNLRKLAACEDQQIFGGLPPGLSAALDILSEKGILEWGDKPENEFFVIKLKDRAADRALAAYADGYRYIDEEYASEVRRLARRSGSRHSLCKYAD